ncbi:MAG: hypothetical protein FRX48_05405 [Lasallia pustulata]|uniref:Uncharacterized protein n=1 Tax=Lasallia pustulata TaxID=136370 RepID=A0A5M8PNP3_9LECA|nr:MAG: hypothetical protein FRX48_05405 [Lasallia pustulata]
MARHNISHCPSYVTQTSASPQPSSCPTTRDIVPIPVRTLRSNTSIAYDYQALRNQNFKRGLVHGNGRKPYPHRWRGDRQLFLGPGWLVALPLKAVGFGAAGVGGGTIAAWWQASAYGGSVPAGSVFAVLQAAGATMGI